MENNNKKTPRASQTREKQSKPKVWTPPSALDAPPAPNGFRHRWVRAESLGFQDTKNVSGRIRQGYELVRSDEYPDSDYPIVEDGKYAGVIGVDNDLMKEQHSSMPINVDRQTRVTFGGSKKN